MKLNHVIPWWNRIKVKFLVFGIVMSILPLATLAYFHIKAAEEDLLASIHKRNKDLVNQVAADIHQLISGIEDKIGLAGTLYGSQIFQMDRRNQEKILYTLLRDIPSVEDIILFDHDANEITRVSRREVIDYDKLSQLPPKLVGSKGVISSYLASDGRTMVSLLVPINSIVKPEVAGGFYVQVNLRPIIDAASARLGYKEGEIFVVNRKGKLIGHEDFSHVLRQTSVTESLAVREFKDGKSNLGEIPLRYISFTGEEVLGAFAPIKKVGWGAVAEIPVKKAYKPVSSLSIKLFLITILVVILVIIVSIHFTLRFTKPIEALEQGAIQVGRGELNITLPKTTADEIGRLVDTFNLMTRELRLKSQELLEEKSRLDQVVSGIGAGLALLNNEKTIVWANEKLLTWFKGTELTGQNYEDIFPGAKDTYQEVSLANENMEESITTATLGKGRRFFRHRFYNLTAKTDAPAQPRQLVVIEDITEERKMEALLIQTEKMAALGLLSAGVAHEINNPLATVSAYAEDLLERMNDQEDVDASELAGYLEVIRKQTERGKKITRSLLTFARQPAGSFIQIYLNELLEDTLALVNYRIKQQGIQVIKEMEPDLPEIKGDLSLLQQVFLNIISNSLDAMETSGGQLRLVTERNQHFLIINVIDSGIGITMEELDKVFDPFYTTKPVGKGTGLGLAICYGIIKEMKGDIQISSEPGKGSMVSVYLPFIDEGRGKDGDMNDRAY